MEDDLTDKLKKFRLSDKEGSGLVVEDEDFATGLEECQLSLIGKIFGEKRVNFDLAEDKDKILYGKTWSFDGQYLLLKEWSPASPNFTEEDEKIKIWVQVHHLPLHWITAAIGVKIGKMIGKVLDVSLPGLGSPNGMLLKIRVEMSLKEAIPRGMTLKSGQESRWVDFKYEILQHFYYYCCYIGHFDKNCKANKEDLDDNVFKLGQFGEWLKASSNFFNEARNYKSSETGGTKEDSHVKVSSKAILVYTPSEGKDDTSIRGTPSPLSLDKEVDSTAISGSSEVGKEMHSHVSPMAPEHPLYVPPSWAPKEQLVEVAVQPTTIENRTIQKRRKFLSSKKMNKSDITSIPEDMVVEVSISCSHVIEPSRVSTKRNLDECLSDNLEGISSGLSQKKVKVSKNN
ncbi:Unknown protein [Striga hermonthica]|uniref:Zinc knuckle CX2CX4HX4C domain-containing protein n=1 Tax=Striga hermonthica TaxID=68872 RepID=A0A9N7N2Y0_STRHE|nr:Unknown protein [Striga hermonthica]